MVRTVAARNSSLVSMSGGTVVPGLRIRFAASASLAAPTSRSVRPRGS